MSPTHNIHNNSIHTPRLSSEEFQPLMNGKIDGAEEINAKTVGNYKDTLIKIAKIALVLIVLAAIIYLMIYFAPALAGLCIAHTMLSTIAAVHTLQVVGIYIGIYGAFVATGAISIWGAFANKMFESTEHNLKDCFWYILTSVGGVLYGAVVIASELMKTNK